MYNTSMINWFKKHFIPHPGNDHKPHFLRRDSILAVFLLVIIVEMAVLVQTLIVFKKTDLLGAVLPAVLTSLTNQDRALNGVNPLKENDLLDKAATMKARDMATRGYFSHTTPDGKTPWYWLEQAGYKYSYAGENLAVNFFESKDVAEAWMNSPTHRANIVKKEFTEVGIGVASGMYEGKNTVFVVQFFGTPVAPIQEKNSPKVIAKVESKVIEKIIPVEEKIITDASIPVETRVLGETTSVEPNIENVAKISSVKLFFEKVITSPREYSIYIFMGILSILVMALLLAFFVKKEIKHPSILIRGLIMILVILLLLYLNLRTLNVETKVPYDTLGINSTNSIAK